MSKEQLKHIFEPSACLSARQLKSYVSGKMVHEEAHAVEAHLMSCPFCSEAVEGLMETKGSLNTLEKLDAGFIAKQLGVSTQEIKNITAAPPVTKANSYSTQPEKATRQPVNIPWKPLAAAAAFVGVVSIAWVMRDNIFPKIEETSIAQEATKLTEEVIPAIAYTPPAEVIDTTAIAADGVLTEQAPVQPKAADVVPQDQKALLAKKEAEKKTADAAKKDVAMMRSAQTQPAIAAEQKAAAPTTNNATTTRAGNSFTGPEVPPAMDRANVSAEAEEKKESSVDASKAIAKRASTGMEKADEFYNKGRYKKALKIYQDEMYDSRSNKRDAATYMAAQCHAAMGETKQAKTLLNSLIDKNSYKKTQAQQLLDKLEQ